MGVFWSRFFSSPSKTHDNSFLDPDEINRPRLSELGKIQHEEYPSQEEEEEDNNDDDKKDDSLNTCLLEDDLFTVYQNGGIQIYQNVFLTVNHNNILLKSSDTNKQIIKIPFKHVKNIQDIDPEFIITLKDGTKFQFTPECANIETFLKGKVVVNKFRDYYADAGKTRKTRRRPRFLKKSAKNKRLH